MSTLEITIPYIWYRHPPKKINIPEMLKVATKQLNKWTETITFDKNYDAIHLEQHKKQEDGLYLKYTIVKNKWKNIKKGE